MRRQYALENWHVEGSYLIKALTQVAHDAPGPSGRISEACQHPPSSVKQSRSRYQVCLSSAKDKLNVSCNLPSVPSFRKRIPDTMKLTQPPLE